jgi:hypothetical protein
MLPAILAIALVQLQEPRPPKHISVRPVFVVPAGEAAPTTAQAASLLRHLRMARDRYTALLDGRDSFALDTAVSIVRIAQGVRELRGLPEDAVPTIVAALLDTFRVSRVTNPWIFVTVVMNPREDYPVGGGRPINGGFNTGGGVVALSSWNLDRVPYFQSTLQHELGHAFGLVHVDVYGHDMQRDSSLMSYNPGHHTNGLLPSRTPGGLGAEERRTLSLNHRVFPHVAADTAGFAPVPLGPMDLPGHPPYPR